MSSFVRPLQAVPEALLELLTDGVLAAPLPTLALELRSGGGGEHRLRRAIALAELVLREGADTGRAETLVIPGQKTKLQSRSRRSACYCRCT